MLGGGRVHMCEQGVLRGEAGGRVRARQSHDLTGAGAARDQRHESRVGMLLAGLWLRGTGFERAIERAPEDRATSHGRRARSSYFVHRYDLDIYRGGGTHKPLQAVEYIYSYTS